MPLLVERPMLGSESIKKSMFERQNLRADYRWISAEEKNLRKKYLNKYIAVKNHAVVLADRNVYTLMNKLRAKGISVDTIAVEFVSEHPTCFLL